MMKILPIAALAIAATAAQAIPVQARSHVVRHRMVHHRYLQAYNRESYEAQRFYGRYDGPIDPYGVPAYGRGGRVPIGTYGEPVPFRTVQPTDVGIGILAPNGYRGPGTASGGPAGGIDNGGGR